MAVYTLDDVRGGEAVVACIGEGDPRGGDLIVEDIRDQGAKEEAGERKGEGGD